MAAINNPDITNEIKRQIDAGTLTAESLVPLVNRVLQPGQQLSAGGGATTGIYKRFAEFDKVNAKVEVVTTGLWSNDSGSLTNIYSSSIQSTANSGYYYVNALNLNPNISDSEEVQFAIAWGSYDGSGSVSLDKDDNALMATKATYAQYKSLLLSPTDDKFQFTNYNGIATSCNQIYVLNVARSRYREKMDAGNWSLKLSGSNGIFTFIDNSGKKFSDTAGLSGNVFAVVSGSLNLGTQSDATIASSSAHVTNANGEGFGAFYPDRGIIVLNAKAIGATVGNIPNHQIYIPSGSTGTRYITDNLSGSLETHYDAFNQHRLFEAIKGGANFEARRTENVSTQHFFVRATNREYNYSNNPTYVNANGTFSETSFNTDPYTYITTVGLYNDSNELVAVAKTSQPIPKSFDKEVLIKVKLSF
jgi:hypothetical protein